MCFEVKLLSSIHRREYEEFAIPSYQSGSTPLQSKSVFGMLDKNLGHGYFLLGLPDGETSVVYYGTGHK